MYEILDNAIDEVQAGEAANVDVSVDLASGWVTVADDGRGIPVDTHPATGKSSLETVLTVLHAGGKFGGEGSGRGPGGGAPRRNPAHAPSTQRPPSSAPAPLHPPAPVRTGVAHMHNTQHGGIIS